MLQWTIANTSETKKKRKKFFQIEDIKNWMKNTVFSYTYVHTYDKA